MDALFAVLMIVFLVALAMAGIGWLWIVGTAFSKDPTWGLLTLFIWPLAFIYGMRNLPQTKIPLLLLGIGVVIALVLIAIPTITDSIRMSQ